VLLPGGCFVYKSLDPAAPDLTITVNRDAIGRSPVRITVEADEPRYGITDLRATFVQGSIEVPLGEVLSAGRPWWRFWGEIPRGSALLETEVGTERIPEMQEGAATIRAEATNDSWARLGKGRTRVVERPVTIMLTPPRAEVLSGRIYLAQGGSGAVRYRVSDSATTSGARVGDAFFKGYPVPGGSPGERSALFAFPYDAPASTVPVVVAADAAGNTVEVPFVYQLASKPYPTARMELGDDFLRRVVPAILSRTPAMTSEGDLLKDFLRINGALRREAASTLIRLSERSKPERLWTGAFTQLGGSKVEAPFAEHRIYRYGGRIVDEQDHLGYDLAVTANHPVGAANDGSVVMAGWFGIYGNTVVLDHGQGLMSLYSHLSSIEAKEGDAVKRGQVVGRSGATGLAGGDHLHFSILVHGVFVNPVEWWDPHWIQDRIEPSLGAAAPGS